MRIILPILGLLLSACSSPAPTMQGPAPATNSSPASPASPSASRVPDEAAALDAIAKINGAQATYFKLNRRYALTYEELVEAHLLTGEPTAAQTGYEFKLRPAADAQTYKLSVTPAASTPTARHFFTDQSAVIRAEEGKDASAASPKL
jgi:hypothetical protein